MASGSFPRSLFAAARRDNLTGEAAKVAYYFFLSLFPLILALFALAGIFGGEAAFAWAMARIRALLPEEAAGLLSGFVAEITGQSRPGMLSLGLLLTLWSASNIFAGLTDGLNAMYAVDETRSWWKKRGLAVIVLIAAAFLLLGGTAALLVGPEIVVALGIGEIWNVLRWPLAFLLLWMLMTLIYFVLPNRDQRSAWSAVVVGAFAGTALWVLATLMFRLYVANFGSYSQTYGFVGAIIVLLLWLYVTALSILLGGEVAATLEARK